MGDYDEVVMIREHGRCLWENTFLSLIHAGEGVDDAIKVAGKAYDAFILRCLATEDEHA